MSFDINEFKAQFQVTKEKPKCAAGRWFGGAPCENIGRRMYASLMFCQKHYPPDVQAKLKAAEAAERNELARKVRAYDAALAWLNGSPAIMIYRTEVIRILEDAK